MDSQTVHIYAQKCEFNQEFFLLMDFVGKIIPCFKLDLGWEQLVVSTNYLEDERDEGEWNGFVKAVKKFISSELSVVKKKNDAIEQRVENIENLL